MRPGTRFALALGFTTLSMLLAFGQTAPGRAQAQGRTDPELMTISRSGDVLNQHSTKAIFWGKEWNDSAFAEDVNTGLDSFFQGFGNSRLAQIATEYGDRSGPISAASTYLGHTIDSSAPPVGTLTSSQVIGEACTQTNNNPDPNGVYFIYTSTPGNVQCALRFWGTCGTKKKPIQAVYIPTINKPGSTCTFVNDDGSGHSPTLSQYGNVTGNQLMNAITDPRGTGWVDASGDGISFKCDGIFPPGGALFSFSNGTSWRVRAKWSNAAYLAGTGLPNLAGLKGCVY